MRKIINSVGIVSCLVISACAPSPSAVEPVSMGNAFSTIPCVDVPPMLNVERNRVVALSQQQRNAATNDAVGVFLIGVPVSSLSDGDVSGELAASKGKVIALENRAVSCGYS